MARKNYPFSEKEYKYGEKTLWRAFNLFTAPIASFNSLSSNMSNEPPIQIESTTNLKIFNYIMGVCHVLSLALGVVLYVVYDWYLFIVICGVLFLQIFTLVPIDIIEELKQYITFHKNSLDKEYKDCKTILIWWIIIFIIEGIFCVTALLFLWYYNYLFDVSAPTIVYACGLAISQLGCAVISLIIFKKLDIYISQNYSFISIAQNETSVDFVFLQELFEQKGIHYFKNNWVIETIHNDNILECGFAIVDINAKKHIYKLSKYVKCTSELLLGEKNIYSLMAEDINKLLSSNIINYRSCLDDSID